MSLSDVIALLRQASQHCDLRGVSPVLDAVLQSHGLDRAAARSMGLEKSNTHANVQGADTGDTLLFSNVEEPDHAISEDPQAASISPAHQNLLLLAQYYDADQNRRFLVQLQEDCALIERKVRVLWTACRILSAEMLDHQSG